MKRRPGSRYISCLPPRSPPAGVNRESLRSDRPSRMRYSPQPASACGYFPSPRATLPGADAMNTTPAKKSRPILWTLLGLVAIGAIVAAYNVFGPHPTDFAGGRRVALADYTQGDPTGVPAELKSA